jgi:hypothetical protein
MIEAGAPIPYVMRQVGHHDSRTTLEIYAQVQQRLARTEVHQAFDDLFANAGGLPASASQSPRLAPRDIDVTEEVVDDAGAAPWSAQLVHGRDNGPRAGAPF